ncbi:MAG: phage major capsid protein, partial [Alkalispirochaeta sp.]
MNKKQLMEKRHSLALKARAILNDAQEESRSLTSEESEKFDRIMADVDQLDEQMQRMDRLDDVDSRGADIQPMDVPPQRSEPQEGNYRSAFLEYLRRGKSALNGAELRALETGESAEGGALTYQEFEAMIVEKLQEQNVIRQVATVISTGGDRNIPVEDGEGTATWISEEGAYSESLDGGDPEDTFTRKVLQAHKLQYLIKVSEELLQDSSFDLESYLARMIGRRLGDGEESAFVAGDGSGKPTGIIT